MHELINRLNVDTAFCGAFTEAIITDLISQLDVLDPKDDSVEILNHFQWLCSSNEGKELLMFMLGVKDLDEVFLAFEDEYDAEL